MNTSSVRGNQTKPFPSRRVATVAARSAIKKSDLQKQLGEKLGGFVWKVEMWPNWLQVYVDKLGNDGLDHHAASDIASDWADENQEQLQKMFSGVLGDKFPELSILGKNMGPNNPYGSCCRTGCGGCFNGRNDRLVDKLKDPNMPVDKFG